MLHTNNRGLNLKDPAILKKIIVGVIVVVVFGSAAFVWLSGKDEASGPVVKNAGAAGTVIVGDADVSPERSDAGNDAVEANDAVKTHDAASKDSGTSGSTPDTSANAASEARDIYVDVAGAVASPGVVVVKEGSRVFEAINAAGGLSGDADTKYLNRAALLSDGDRVYVPTALEVAEGSYTTGGVGAIGPDTAALGASGSAGGSTGSTGAGESSADTNAKININTADSATLQQLNGVGPSTAQKIIDYRNAHGAFRRVEDIQNVSGIGAKTFAKLKERIIV